MFKTTVNINVFIYNNISTLYNKYSIHKLIGTLNSKRPPIDGFIFYIGGVFYGLTCRKSDDGDLCLLSPELDDDISIEFDYILINYNDSVPYKIEQELVEYLIEKKGFKISEIDK